MKEKLEVALLKEFPGLFELDYGFQCGDGWYKLIRELSRDLYVFKKNLKSLKVLQVKEKFGGLRFYIEPSFKEALDLIDIAQENSFYICEECGESGTLRIAGWLRTLCDKHAKEYGYEERKKKTATKIRTLSGINKPTQ